MRVLKEAVRSLPCKLSHEEVHAYGKQLASVDEDIREEEYAQEQQKKQMKAKLSSLESTLADLALKVRREQEYREVTCEWRADDLRGEADLIRIDTFEVVETRKLTDAEKQLPLLAEA